ncbi:hypothetical protein [Aeromonas molluscorum]|uniref:hypothetical protein n=1 Tax=Aeromonas molluscorum TaxID=271417 RepID=UPI0012695BCF|nr:hypothetical protein [Aeromonas molluscorum]
MSSIQTITKLYSSKIVKFIFIMIFLIYFIAMFICPFIDTEFDFLLVQKIWSNWQSFNAGMLALLASIIALATTMYQSEKQRQRDLIAAKVFLSESLNELHDYYISCAALLHFLAKKDKFIEPFPQPDLTKLPLMPTKYRDGFSTCIKLSPPETVDALSHIVLWLPIHEHRLKNSLANYQPSNLNKIQHLDVMNGILHLGVLMSITLKLYSFCRTKDEHVNVQVGLDEMYQALNTLNIETDNVNGLKEYIERKLPVFDYDLS